MLPNPYTDRLCPVSCVSSQQTPHAPNPDGDVRVSVFCKYEAFPRVRRHAVFVRCARHGCNKHGSSNNAPAGTHTLSRLPAAPSSSQCVHCVFDVNHSFLLGPVMMKPRSFFMDVKCPGCFNITTVFSHAQVNISGLIMFILASVQQSADLVL